MRVMIAEDSGLLRQLLADMLVRRGIEVTGQATRTQELLRMIEAAPPDVVVLDIRMPPDYRDEGLQAAEAIRARFPRIGLLVLSQYAETSYAARLLEHGATGIGYLLKDRVHSSERLVDAISRVAAGEAAIDPEVVDRLMSRRRVVDPLERLADGERQVLRLMAEGLSNLAIAQRLSYSRKTVEKRATAIIQKLDLASSGDAHRSDVNVRVLAVLTYLRDAKPLTR